MRNNELDKVEAIDKAINNAIKNDAKLHIMGLCSDGGVHSHVDHIKYLLEACVKRGVKEVVVHCFLDGRDVPPKSAVLYLKQIQDKIDEVGNSKIGVVSGRYYAMDRDKNLDRVDKAYQVMVNHNGVSYVDPEAHILENYANGITDEFMTPAYNVNSPKLTNNDGVIFMNFRPDRAIQLSTILTNPTFYPNYTPSPCLENIELACMMKYSDSCKGTIAYELPKLTNVLGPYLASKGVHQLRIAETEKYAHVTFFFDATVNYDGVNAKELENCKRVLVNSPKVATYDLQPEMSAYLVTDALLKEIESDEHDVIILNYANCDMVGHTAVNDAVIKAVETVDECVGKIHEAVKAKGGVMLITADHGNADCIIDEDGKPMTAHTTSPVPLIVTSNDVELVEKTGKLGDLAPTMLYLLNLEIPSEMEGKVLVKNK
jgi:2,3-bisphosphoglycerate-independent phosphoglycerate mutase